MWRLRSWKRIMNDRSRIFGEWRVDYCRFGTRWRKRTRFATNTSLQGEVRLCDKTHEHWKLRGMHGGVSRTKLAEPYLYPLCASLASACCKHAGWIASSRRLNIVGCAKCHGCSYHIGDAMHLGPPPLGRLLLHPFAEVTALCPHKAGTYFSLCEKSVAPCLLAACSCNASRRLQTCDHPDALGVHVKPLPPFSLMSDRRIRRR